MMHTMPREDVKRKLLASVERTPSPPRSAEVLRAMLVLGGACLAALGIFAEVGGVRGTGRPLTLMVGTALGSCAVAGLGANILLGRGRKMLGRPRSTLAFAAVLLPLALLSWKVLYSAQFAHGLDRWVTRIGYRCLAVELSIGVAPLLALLYVRRGTDPSHPATAGLAIGISVGLVVAVLTDMWCPVAYVPHFLLGHLLPIVILGVVGLLVGRRILQI